MNAKSSSLQKYIDVLGEAEVIKAIQNANSRDTPGNILNVTNPIIRFMQHTTYIKNNKLYTRQDMNVPGEDYSLFKITSSILNDLREELGANISYKNQLTQKILHNQAGPMLAAFNEILAGAYYKSLGIKVGLNSSEQEGAADIDLLDLPYATDAKTYPNNRLLLEAIINESAQEIVDAVDKVQNQCVLIMVKTPNKKQFHRSLAGLKQTFEDPSQGKYNDNGIYVTIVDDTYQAGDLNITVQPKNVNVFFQANWDFADSIEVMKISINKAVEQSRKLGKQAIPWIMVPRDANRNGIEVQMLRFVAKFHEFVFQNKDIYVMPVFALDFEGTKVGVIFDVHQTGSNTLGINALTFEKCIQDLLNRPELYV